MKILVLANFGMGLYNFRKELLEELIKQNYEVYISLPNDEYVPKLEEIGCKFIDTPLNRRGTNPIDDMKLVYSYVKILNEIKPDVVLTYTIKPNVYGGLACRITKTPYITNITGLGTAIENEGILQKITLQLYKTGLKKSSCIFFQNKTNQSFFIERNLVQSKSKLIPGSGVNLEEHNYEEYPKNDKQINLLFIGRIMKAKGIDELLEAAQIIKQNHSNVQFDLVGGIEEDYIVKLSELESQDIIKYHGQQSNIHSFIKDSHGVILPSHHEGLSNVLLESASSGRPLIASNIPGCAETFTEGITGFGFVSKNVDSLVTAISKFINLLYDQKIKMGVAGREKMEQEFSRDIVVKSYIDEISLIVNKE